MSCLIITNGDSGAQRLRDAGLGHEILCWQDMLHEGPVPMTSTTAALTSIRSQFLSEIDSRRKTAAELYQRDRVLAGSAIFKQIVVWFEHDLFDQLQLIQVLDQLASHNFKDTAVSMVSAPKYVGQLMPDEARQLFAARTPITEEQYDIASRAWVAFRSNSPVALQALLKADDLRPLPFLSAAIWRLLEEYPGVDGLSRSERQILQALQKAGKAVSATELLDLSHRDMEDPVWLGGWAFVLRLQQLSSARKPAITLIGATDNVAADSPFAQELQSKVELASFGSELLSGKVDAVSENGIDRWLGGVHLTKDSLWRWQEKSRTLEKAR